MTTLKIGLASDLHLEFYDKNSSIQKKNWKKLLKEAGFPRPQSGPELLEWLDLVHGPNWLENINNMDVILLPGDITKGNRLAAYTRNVAKITGLPVISIPGNHEYYGTPNFKLLREEMISKRDYNWAILDRDVYEFQHHDKNIRILGTTLWTDFDFYHDKDQSMEDAKIGMNDFKIIGNFLPTDAYGEHQLSKHWLEEKLKEDYNGTTIIMTHHAPSKLCDHPKYSGGLLTPAFLSNMDDFIKESKATAWAYGHVHWNPPEEIKIGQTLLMTNQEGYLFEYVPHSTPIWHIEI